MAIPFPAVPSVFPLSLRGGADATTRQSRRQPRHPLITAIHPARLGIASLALAMTIKNCFFQLSTLNCNFKLLTLNFKLIPPKPHRAVIILCLNLLRSLPRANPIFIRKKLNFLLSESHCPSVVFLPDLVRG